MTEDPAPRRRIPCSRCRYDLRGRFVGESCPECGWVIDAPGPLWCTDDTLRRLARMSRLARSSSLLLVAGPALFVVALLGAGDRDRLVFVSGWTLVACLAAQVALQATAVWRMAIPELGASRMRALRVATVVRAAAFGLGGAFLIAGALAESIGPMFARVIFIFGYFLLPLAAIGADFAALRALGSLRRESEAPVSGRHAVMPPLARWALVGIYPLMLVPFLGWFLAPICWGIALSFGFAQVGAVAEACRKQLP